MNCDHRPGVLTAVQFIVSQVTGRRASCGNEDYTFKRPPSAHYLLIGPDSSLANKRHDSGMLSLGNLRLAVWAVRNVGIQFCWRLPVYSKFFPKDLLLNLPEPKDELAVPRYVSYGALRLHVSGEKHAG
jgi:hypothetical protein